MTGRLAIRAIRLRTALFIGAIVIAVVAFMSAKPLHRWYGQLQYERHLGMRDLVTAADGLPFRAIAPRLTGGFAYRPPIACPAGSKPDGSRDGASPELYASVSGDSGRVTPRTYRNEPPLGRLWRISRSGTPRRR